MPSETDATVAAEGGTVPQTQPGASAQVAGARETVRVREVLAAMPSYVPGKAVARTDGVTTYKVSSNENPNSPLPSVLDVIKESAAHVNRYPDMAVVELTACLADALQVPTECVATGTGSVGVLGQVISAMCDAGDEVVYAWRSFEAYPIVTAIAGARSVPVPLTPEHRHDLPAMAAAVTDRTKVVIVCSPNNPTGTVVHDDELRAFLAEVPSHVLVVLDEAYVEYVRDPRAPDALAVWRAHPNVMVLRTFSKAYGLAGLRVGYAVAHPDVAAALRKTAVPFGVSSLAQVAAIASLDAHTELLARVDDLVQVRDEVTAALAQRGWRLPDTAANFVWFPLGDASSAFAVACDAAGLLVRQYGNDGVRVTLAEPEANARLLEVASAFAPR